MATALTAVPTTPSAASVSEALLEQLIAARVKIGALIVAFERDARQRSERAQRELADQVAPVLAAAPEPPDVRLVDALATRLSPLIEMNERDERHGERLEQVKSLLDARIEELKKSPADRALMVKVLKAQRDKLETELARNDGRRAELAAAIARIGEELKALDGGSTAAKKRARRS
jgi:undecaprenyl pyrophosphate synthase